MKRVAVLLLVGVVTLGAGLAIFLFQRAGSNRGSVSTADSTPGTASPLRNPSGSTSTNQSVAASAARPPVTASPATIQTNQNALADFSRWAEQFLSGNTAASLAHGEALAWKRREAMLELIESDPERALKLTVPYEWRAALPPRIARHFESWVDGRGDLTVAVATDFDLGRTRTIRFT